MKTQATSGGRISRAGGASREFDGVGRTESTILSYACDARIPCQVYVLICNDSPVNWSLSRAALRKVAGRLSADDETSRVVTLTSHQVKSLGELYRVTPSQGTRQLALMLSSGNCVDETIGGVLALAIDSTPAT